MAHNVCSSIIHTVKFIEPLIPYSMRVCAVCVATSKVRAISHNTQFDVCTVS